MPSHRDVSHLRVHQRSGRLRHNRGANTSTYRHVREGAAAAARAELPFRQRGARHIRIKCNRHIERVTQGPNDVSAGPSRFGRCHHPAVSGGLGTKIEWTETTETERSDSAMTLLRVREERHALVQCRCRVSRPNDRALENLAWGARHGTDELRASALDRPV